MKTLRLIILLTFVLGGQVALAGNPERAGQAGATQLLINPYARSGGFNGINTANAYGIEATFNNPAGVARTKKTELVFAHTRYLVGADININTFGISQSLKKGGVIGLTATAFDMGDFVRTTIDQPDGTLGTFSPTIMNIGLTYAKTFVDDRIFVGFTVRMIHESISDVAANGVSMDAGVQYVDKKDRIRIGVCLKNVGPDMKFAGDGLATRANLGGNNSGYTSSVSTSASKFQLPSLLNIGAAYEVKIGATDSTEATHKIIPMVNFSANAFGNDRLGAGIEYRFKRLFMLRAAYLYENKMYNKDENQTTLSGISLGATVEIPFKLGEKATSSFGLDYSYRSTFYFNGIHTFGCRVNL